MSDEMDSISTLDLENPATEALAGELPVFALYVSRGSHWSDRAETLVLRLYDAIRSKQDCELQVINVNSEASGALANRVFVTPTLIKVSPPPEARLIGQFADPDVVERFLRSGSGFT